MDLKQFETELARDGYTERVEREMKPNTVLKAHTHEFDVRALMLAGELKLTWNGATQVYRAGEVFTMAAGCEHAEDWGADGARYFVGRRHSAKT